MQSYLCFAISCGSSPNISMGKRELAVLLCLSSLCLVIVVWLFLMMPRVCLQFWKKYLKWALIQILSLFSLLNVTTKINNFPTYLPYILLVCNRNHTYNDSFTILGLWVLGLTVSHINESNCKLMSSEHYF